MHEQVCGIIMYYVISAVANFASEPVGVGMGYIHDKVCMNKCAVCNLLCNKCCC
jgi:hypothetical protein